MPTSGIATLCFFTTLMVTAVGISGQAVGGADGARPVQGDPGISSMLVLEDTALEFSAITLNLERPDACMPIQLQPTKSSCL